MKILTLPGLAAALLLLAPTTNAQSNKLQQDLQFIRGLVKDLRFIELAQFETENLKKVYKGSEEFKMVAQLGIEVSLEGAKRHPNREEQRGLYKEALDKSAAFIERYAGEPVALDARITLIQAILEYGQFIVEEIGIAREETPDKLKALEEEAANTFRKGATAAKAVMTHFKNKGQEEDINYFLAWMRKGVMEREHGRAVKTDRGALCDMAKETLEELILEVGEETALGQRALFEMAQVEEVLGNIEDAASSYNDTTHQILEALNNEELNLPEPVQRLMFDMLQEIYDKLAHTYFELGQSNKVVELMATYRNNLKEFDAEAHSRFGDSLYLTEAQIMAESGKQEEVTKALATAKRINKRHPNDFVGLKAKKLIDTILRRSSNLVTGEGLLEVAKGFYQEKKYDAAIDRFKDALRGMSDGDRQKLGLETWDLMGRCNSRLGRDLEAALCHKKALELFAETTSDQETKKRVAGRMSRAFSRAERNAKDATAFASMRSEVDALVAANDPSKAEAKDYAGAQSLYMKGKYGAAAAAFANVESNYEKYEMAIAFRVDCLVRSDAFTEAQKVIADYQAWLKTTAAELPKNQTVKIGYRAQAIRALELATGRILFSQAIPGRQSKLKPDLTKVPGAIKALLAWEQKHGKNASPNLQSNVHGMLGELYIRSGSTDKVIDRYTKLKAIPGDKHKRLGFLLFDYYSAQVSAAETQLNAIAKNAKKDDTALTTATARLRDAQQRLIDFGRDYTKSLGKPPYTVMYSAMSTAEDVREWLACEELALKILKLYEKDPRWSKHATFIRVKPTLGNALLHQPNKLQRALDMLVSARKSLEAAGKEKTAGYYEIVRMVCLAKGGWPDLDKVGNYRPIAGMGKPIEAIEEYYREKKINQYFNGRRVQRYTLPWYRFHLECLFMARQAAKKDSKYKDFADTLYRIAKSTDEFRTLRALGQKGRDYYYMFQELRR